MPNTNTRFKFNPTLPLFLPPLMGPNLDVTVAEAEVCGHEILTTFIDDEFVGIFVGKNGKQVYSYLKEADNVLQTKKDS